MVTNVEEGKTATAEVNPITTMIKAKIVETIKTILGNTFDLDETIMTTISTLATQITTKVEAQVKSGEIELKSETFTTTGSATADSTADTGSSVDEDKITKILKSKNIFYILVLFFGFGLLLSLTPCVFPMIPILSSILVSQGKNHLRITRGT